MWNIIWFILVVLSVVAFGAAVLAIYNNLIGLRNRVENDWFQINVELERRASLIENLVETVKGYVEHEKTTLKEVTKALFNLIDAETVKENANANRQLTESLKSLFVVLENYPSLKADKSFGELMEQLDETEDVIAEYREFYNDMVYIYNNKCQVFPSNLVANYFNFKEVEFFEPGEGATSIQGVEFDASLPEGEYTPQE